MAASEWRYTVVLTGTLQAEDEDEAREVAYEEAIESGDVLDVEVEPSKRKARVTVEDDTAVPALDAPEASDDAA